MAKRLNFCPGVLVQKALTCLLRRYMIIYPKRRRIRILMEFEVDLGLRAVRILLPKRSFGENPMNACITDLLGPQQEEGPSSEDPSLLDSSVEREESCNAERNGKEETATSKISHRFLRVAKRWLPFIDRPSHRGSRRSAVA
ncbi:hypothetical protein TNCT_718751 [Trichonephila clavata]|uniref:Uncharacterized protein n=1 Tax=Trichonephila clavata TaxID=2740835 RepID=A0A8X6L8G1_TRICU|nr:hypothetical protein TNCT_718751 [Trichonephila clavata]